MKRLQGSAWHTMKKDLTMIDATESANGNIRGIYVDKKGYRFFHWLNDEEKIEFKYNELIVKQERMLCDYMNGIKPPLGVTPKYIRDLERMKELSRAINDYINYYDYDVDTVKDLLAGWISELDNLLFEYKGE